MSSRGKNFTEKEKCKLLELVQKYKHIIENKCTNAISTIQKHKAWVSVASQFNSAAEVPRTQKQLYTAYLNLKRSSRQNVASENVRKYLSQQQKTSSVNEPGTSPTITLVDEKGMQAQKGTTTGGGVNKPILSSVGDQMLTMMGDQVTPLSNNCDNASNYYKNDQDQNDLTNEESIIHPDIQDDIMTRTDSIPQAPVTTTKSQAGSKKFRQIISTKKKKITYNKNLIRQYYLKKMECVQLEKEIKLSEYRMTLRKEKLLDLDIKIKQKEYENILNK